MLPKGTLIIIGGAEEKGDERSETRARNRRYERFEILRELLPKGSRKRIEIITTASEEPQEVARKYRAAFRHIGYTGVGALHLHDKSQAKEKKVCDRIKAAHAVFFSGGDQFRITSILGGTEMMELIKEKYQQDSEFLLAGTSAGAMAMSKIMIYEGGIYEALFKDDLKTTLGLDILDKCIVDTHFIRRGRFGRLAHAIIMNTEMLGIGLGEDTMLVIRKGYEAECKGSGMVVIIDGHDIVKTNIRDVDTYDPIFVENLKVHLLVKGNKFNLKDKKVIA